MAEDKSSSMVDKVYHRSDQPSEFSHKWIKQITNNFDKELIIGAGGFGTVYKGICENKEEIAVKVLKDTLEIDSKDFQQEFENLKRFKHQNVVELVGFCNESDKVVAEYEGKKVIAEEIHRVLCFEYVPNGSLTKHISAIECSRFNWHIRYKIIKGICDGLEYLRQGPEFSLWHLDLKPDNILLDNNMIPKIADFGLSRLLHDENTRKTVNFQGTRGYMPPEYIDHGLLTKEFDIFSLGVIIAKIMAGEKDYYKFADVEGDKFIKHVHDNWRKRLRKTLPPRPRELYCEQVTKCIQIAVQCMKRDREQRPNIQSIVSDLRETEIKICSLGPTEEFWEEESILHEEGIKDRPAEMAADASRCKADNSILSTLPKELPLDFLRIMTDQFSNERTISHSWYGTLYKGTLPDGEEIAVKRVAESIPLARDKVFTNMVQKFMMCGKHENVVQLLGYCHEGRKEVVLNNGRYIVADVFETLLCYEYLPNGSLGKNLFDVWSRIDWETRFEIIKGICQGLLFLHRFPIVHMDLNPENILLDNAMRPKIAEIGMPRFFYLEQMQTRNVVGSYGYMAPEYLYSGEVSTRSDIYSLGLLIMEISTGEKNCVSDKPCGAQFIKYVRENWTKHRIVSAYPLLDADRLKQVLTCIEIGLKCTEIDPSCRPSIEMIVNTLGSNRHLSLQLRRVNFPARSKRLTSSSVCLTNSTKDRVAFRLVAKTPRRYFTKMPLCGIVPPKCTYILTIIMREQKRLPASNSEGFLTLESSTIAHDDDIDDADPASVAVFLDTAGDQVLEEEVAVACESLAETISNDQVLEEEVAVACDSLAETISNDQIIDGQNYREVLSVDVHPTKPWILTSNQRGYVCIWNYQTQEEVDSIEVTREPVYSAKFIERQDWLVVGSGDGCIYVYDYNTMDEVETIEAHDSHRITCLAVNPSHSFLLSASDDHKIKLWEWTKEWHCTRTFEGHYGTVTQVMFDPRNSESFASASLDHTIKIWNIHTATCNITWDGHPEGLLCVHYRPRSCRQFLISGSLDGGAKIWDLETDSCVDSLLEHAKGLSALCWHPELQILVTGSLDGTVRIWNWKSTTGTCRLENIIVLNLGAVHALGYLKGLTRIVVGCDQGIALMDINVV